MKLTAADAEPPIGTIVRDATGRERVRAITVAGDSTYWLLVDDLLHGDPESWVKIAGNYGPVDVIRKGE